MAVLFALADTHTNKKKYKNHSNTYDNLNRVRLQVLKSAGTYTSFNALLFVLSLSLSVRYYLYISVTFSLHVCVSILLVLARAKILKSEMVSSFEKAATKTTSAFFLLWQNLLSEINQLLGAKKILCSSVSPFRHSQSAFELSEAPQIEYVKVFGEEVELAPGLF